MNKIIFLDVDGVLNSEEYYVKAEERHRLREKRLDWYSERRELTNYEIYRADIDDTKVALLQNIIDRTGAKVVVSSTWRTGDTYEALIEIFTELKFTGEIIGVTGHGCNDCVRGNEIHKWIKQNEDLTGAHYRDYTSYVILDDDDDMLYWQRNNFACTNWRLGLNEEVAAKAIKILNKE